jgi:hypothetical protein
LAKPIETSDEAMEVATWMSRNKAHPKYQEMRTLLATYIDSQPKPTEEEVESRRTEFGQRVAASANGSLPTEITDSRTQPVQPSPPQNAAPPSIANAPVPGTTPLTKPDRAGAVARGLKSDFEKLKLADSLGFMVELLGADNPLVKQVLDGKTPEARANELIAGTKLDDPDYRKEVAKGGKAAIEASTDPMLVVAREIDAKAREARKRYENEVIGVERTNYAKIARALFDTEGTKLYPDATFTLRLSYGAVEGYTENGKKVAPLTTLGGLYARADSFNHKFPDNLPPRWMEKKAALDLSTPFNFVSTNDIIGGNSGSPTINQNGELVGLIFDGNRQSMVGDFIYDGSVNRAISVDSRGMLEVLKKNFGANDIAAELTAS